MSIAKLDVLSHIQQRVPSAMPVIDASSWYVDETMTLDFGDYVGRPDENALMHTNMLAYFFAYGWQVDAVLESGSDGEWQSVATAEATSTSTSESSTESSSSATGHLESRDRQSQSGSTDRLYSDTSQSGTSQADGRTVADGTATQTTTSGGAPYWHAYQKIRLKRRRMDGELVLRDMVRSFTDAYNEGRQVNNARYDELVALYALVLSENEDEMNAVSLESVTPQDFIALANEVAGGIESSRQITPEDLRGLYDDAISNIRAATRNLKNAVENLPSRWNASRTDEINRQFDAKIAKAKATMIANGTYNGTAWANVESGFERDRQYALNDLADTLVTLKVDTYGKVATLTTDSEAKLVAAVAQLAGMEKEYADTGLKVAAARQGIMESAERITDAIQKRRLGATELRNTVVKWMFDFMERREDEYPGLDQLTTVAERLGYGDGGAKPA